MKVVAAALLQDGMIYTLPPPARHSTVMRLMADQGVDIRGAEQGFVLDDGRFVRRAPAAVIAFQAGQIKDEKILLYSEDLW